MMKKLMGVMAVVAAFVLLTGCPYYSDVTLSPDKHADAKFLVGTWIDEGSEFGDGEYYTVSEIKSPDGDLLDIVKINPADTTEFYYQGYLTNIDGTLFLNVWELSEDGSASSCYFHKIDKKSETSFVLYEVTENIREEFNDSASLYKFFKENMGKSYFYSAGELAYVKY